jgi:hypothetical protein
LISCIPHMPCIDTQLLSMTTMPRRHLSRCWSTYIAHILGTSCSMGMPRRTSSTWQGCQPSLCGGGRSRNRGSDKVAVSVAARSVALTEGCPGDAATWCPTILGPVCSLPFCGAGINHAGYVHSLSAWCWGSVCCTPGVFCAWVTKALVRCRALLLPSLQVALKRLSQSTTVWGNPQSDGCIVLCGSTTPRASFRCVALAAAPMWTVLSTQDQ